MLCRTLSIITIPKQYSAVLTLSLYLHKVQVWIPVDNDTLSCKPVHHCVPQHVIQIPCIVWLIPGMKFLFIQNLHSTNFA